MAKFSITSQSKLAMCHGDIIEVMSRAIQLFDFTVLYGYRTLLEQHKLYLQGRELVSGIWVVRDKAKIVTHCDGVVKKSRHNYSPSLAVDIAPYPIDWADIQRFIDMAKVVMDIAKEMDVPLRWGGDWTKMKDYPHFELPLSYCDLT